MKLVNGINTAAMHPISRHVEIIIDAAIVKRSNASNRKIPSVLPGLFWPNLKEVKIGIPKKMRLARDARVE